MTMTMTMTVTVLVQGAQKVSGTAAKKSRSTITLNFNDPEALPPSGTDDSPALDDDVAELARTDIMDVSTKLQQMVKDRFEQEHQRRQVVAKAVFELHPWAMMSSKATKCLV